MKTINTGNHIHFRKRTVLEFIGLFVLLYVTYLQRDTIQHAFREIIHSKPIYIFAALAVYWMILPLTAISYRLLSDKRLNIWSTTLAQLSGSGPGRIIPGGLGRISLAVVHLIKLGFSSSRALIITVTSNFIGIIVNVIVLILILFFEPDIASLLNINNTLPSALGLLLLVLISIFVMQWLYHAKKTSNSMLKLTKKWSKQIKIIRKNPLLFARLVAIALLILAGHVIMLLLSAYALNIQIDAGDALIALSVGVLVGGILPTPGGIGGVEAGIASTLIFLGYGPSESTSVALLFRAITYWQPLIPGTIAYFYLRRRKLL